MTKSVMITLTLDLGGGVGSPMAEKKKKTNDKE